ncbi:MAG TPA: trehalose-phosphatase, partial [Planctomycetota bacterium]
MKRILAPAQRELLTRLAWSNALLAFDFDGTLAPIVSDPARAALRPATRRLLLRVARLYPCVIISGRALADVARRVDGLPVRAVIGNHGLEPWSASPELLRTVARWRTRLAPALAELRGVELEDKTYSLALHYRRARAKARARQILAGLAGTLPRARIIGGKDVVNVVPEGAPHKGAALLRERKRLGCDLALFLGDDDTDEDVFALDQPGRLLSVRVGQSRRSLAPYFLRDQAEVDGLLARLVELREARRLARCDFGGGWGFACSLGVGSPPGAPPSAVTRSSGPL